MKMDLKNSIHLENLEENSYQLEWIYTHKHTNNKESGEFKQKREHKKKWRRGLEMM